MNPKVQIQIVTWNSCPHLERLFRGIERQTGVDFNVLVIDNASSDGTVDKILRLRSHAQGALASLRMTLNKENKGFAGAHNQGFARCQAPFVLVLNPDTELQPDFLKTAVKAIESNDRIASVAGKLYRQLPQHPPFHPPLDKGGNRGGIIDSCGLEMRSWVRIVDRGQNCDEDADSDIRAPQTPTQPSPSKGEEVKEVFGPSGACALYRLAALKQVADKHGIFDERFGSYKEDVDLAWRLKRNGWRAVFAPMAIAWHGRGVGKGDRKPLRIRYLSIRNHLLMLSKNLM